MTICRVITCLWPSVPNERKTTILLFGGVIELGRHFRCAWNAWSFDFHTRRAYVCLHPSGIMALGDGCREVGVWWALWSRIQGITIHAGFVGVLSIRLDADMRARSLASLERAEVAS